MDKAKPRSLAKSSRETALRRATGKRRGQAVAKAAEKKKTGIAKGTGRPSLYDPIKTPALAKKYALLGLTDIEISGALDISEDTFYAWKRKYPAFSEGVNEGKLYADAEIANSVYNRARGMTVKSTKAVALRDRVEVVEVEDFLPPDVAAARYWLNNRQPNRWQDRKNVEVSGGIEHTIALMSPEQRLARLLELQQKAGLVIEGQAVEVEPEE